MKIPVWLAQYGEQIITVREGAIYSEFEILFAQLVGLQPASIFYVSDLKVKLIYLAHASNWESKWRSEHFQTVKSPHNNKSIVITSLIRDLELSSWIIIVM